MDSKPPSATSELVRLARRLERELARRRKLQRQLDQLDAEIRSTRKLLSDLARPFPPDAGGADSGVVP